MAEKEIKTKRSNRQKTLDMVYIAIFAVIIAVCSWISVPMVVPFTLQTFGVFCAVGLLGGKGEPYPFSYMYYSELSEFRYSRDFQAA